MNRQQAAGFIETFGYLPAVEAADVCLKTAHVSLAGIKNAGGGLVTIIIRGDVGATKAAIEAGTLAADRVGTVISTHVIARPVDELDIYWLILLRNRHRQYLQIFLKAVRIRFPYLRWKSCRVTGL